jgi:quercetin dioxygenase-like cupin family protein
MFTDMKSKIMQRKEFILSGLMAGIAVTGFGKSLSSTKDTTVLQPFYLPPDNDVLDPAGGVAIRVKVRSSQTNMQYSSVDIAVAPKTMGPAPHLHDALDELMYVHEGTVHVLVGKEVYEVKAGGWHFRPRGIVHTFWNASEDTIARCTDMYFNQNFEDFLEELFLKIRPEMHEKKLSPMHPSIAPRLAALDKKFGITHFHDQRQAIVDKYGLKT